MVQELTTQRMAVQKHKNCEERFHDIKGFSKRGRCNYGDLDEAIKLAKSFSGIKSEERLTLIP